MDSVGHGAGNTDRPTVRRAAPDRPALRAGAERLLAELNAPGATDPARARALDALLGTANGVIIRSPFTVALGRNIHFDEACFVGEGCAILDEAEVLIGAFTQIAPDVRITTADGGGRPARAVRIGRNVWIGAGAMVCPGVVIGDDAIVAAGTIVDQNVPDGATIAGSPSRIML